jgi:polygalacturonase
MLLVAAAAMIISLPRGALPPGPGPFAQVVMPQPVPGARSFASPRLCDVSQPPYSAGNNSNGTAALTAAIADCGDLDGGGVVLVPAGLTLRTASLFLRSNLTLRVSGALIGTATGSGNDDATINDAPIVWARRNAVMVDAHAGMLNGGRCLAKAPAQSPENPDGCLRWRKLENVVVEGGGLLDANASDWYLRWASRPGHGALDYNRRPMMLDFMWVDGLTIRNVAIRRPGYWTVHPTFSNNVHVANNSIITTGANTDGCDPDSSWNVYIANNHFSTGDDCIAIKSGRDWSGRMVNISTRNVLADGNYFEKGHGVSIGSETSGWVTDVVVRNSVLDGTNLAVRLKTSRGRGGGIEGVLYENLSGRTNGGIQLNSACFVPRFVTQASCALRQLHAQRTMGLLPRLTSRRHLSCAT